VISVAVETLASYKKPTRVVVVDELPRNASGKVLKHELRARYADLHASAP
jgi:fatty-acyl-CoA synthase